MQTTRLTSIGSRVEIATLTAVSTEISKNPSTSPGITWKTCLICVARSTAPPAFSRRSYSYLKKTPIAKPRPRIRNISSTLISMPRYLPMMNCRRLIGLDSSVIAVLPSISSATVELDVSRASSRQTNEIVVRPVSLYILMSSPNVKYGT